jgi:hypothetical protein
MQVIPTALNVMIGYKINMETKIHKDELRGKYIEYKDSKGAFRISKVTRTLSVKKANRKKSQTVKMKDVICNIHHGHCRRDIDWNIKKKK